MKQQSGTCNANHRFLNENRNFKLLCKATSSIQPAKGAFDNPAPRKFFPLMRLDFLGNVYPALELLLYFGDKRAAIACIGTKGLN